MCCHTFGIDIIDTMYQDLYEVFVAMQFMSIFSNVVGDVILLWVVSRRSFCSGGVYVHFYQYSVCTHMI